MRNIRVIALSSMFMAMITLVTMFGMIPIAWGYLNLGDTIIMLLASALPVSLMFTIGGIASGLADVLLAYPQYAVFTFVIKGLEGLFVALLFKHIKPPAQRFIPFLIAGFWIALGYGLVDALLYQNLQIGFTSFGLNAIQGFASAFIAIALTGIVTPKLRKLWQNIASHA
jgi:uncharacterized membrane protein